MSYWNIKYGPVENAKRHNFEEKAQYFVISEMLKATVSCKESPRLNHLSFHLKSFYPTFAPKIVNAKKYFIHFSPCF